MSEKSIIEFARFKHFPSLPHVLLKLMEVSADPEVSTLAISKKSLRIEIMAWKTISCN